MAKFDLTEFLEDGSVTLEGIPSKKYPKGHAYKFESPDFETGLWLRNLIEFGQRAQANDETLTPDDVKELVLDDGEESDLYRRVMGSTFARLKADGVKWSHVQQVFGLLLRQWGAGLDIAQSLAEAREAITGEAGARPTNRATRRSTARAKPSGTGSRRTGGAKSNPASTGTPARTSGRTSTRAS